MKLTIARDRLLHGLQLVSVVVPTRSPVPALQNVKLESQGNKLHLIGTDMDVGIRYLIDGVEGDDGVLVVPASRLTGVMRESAAEAVTIETEGTLANVKVGRGRYKIVGTDPVDFPNFPSFDEKNEVEVDADEITTAIDRVQYATSSEMTRYALTGVLFEFSKKGLYLAASDGKRLALMKTKSGKSDKAMKIIVPPKALNLLTRVLTDNEKTIGLQFDENQLKIRTANAEIFTRLIEGNFPDYNAVIPKDNDRKFSLRRDELERALRQVNPLVTEKTKGVKLTFNKHRLTLFTRSADVGEAELDMEIGYDGDTFDIVFNPDFLLEFLKTIDTEDVDVEMKNRTAAGVFREGKNYTYVVMPLNINL